MSKRFPEVVVVTGASAGIGRATVREFARHGAHIGLVARGRDGLEAAQREVEALGGRAVAIPTDVADADAVEQAAAGVEDRFGPIDIWINSAATAVYSPFLEMTPEEFKRVTEVTYYGQVWGARAALKRMVPRDQGSIVLVGSTLARRGIPLQSAFCGAEHATRGFFEAVHTELTDKGSKVQISMVNLPAMNTPQADWVRSHLPNKVRPLGKPFQPEVAAESIYWAAHHMGREVNVGFPSLKAKLAGWFERSTARKEIEAQQRPQRDVPSRADNLFEPVPGDRGAHGPFNREARESSPQLWAATHRGLLAAAGAAMAGAALGVAYRRA